MSVTRKGIPPEWLKANPEAQRMLREGWGLVRRTANWDPPTDVYENEEGLVIQVEIAGMEKEDFEITIQDRRVIIQGVRVDPEPKRSYHQMEILYGEFQAAVHLPGPVDMERVEATYENGFLRIFLPSPPVHRVPVVHQKDEE